MRIPTLRRRVLLASTLAAPFVWRPRAQAADIEGALVFGAPGGSTQTVFEKYFFPEFTERTGVKVSYVAGQPPELLPKARIAHNSNSVAIDVLWLAGGVTYQAIDEGIVAPLNLDLLPNYAATVPSLKTEKAAAACGLAVTGLVYNSDVYAKHNFVPPNSWWNMWDAGYAGHVGSYTIIIAAQQAWFAHISQLLTGQYRNFDAAFAKCKQLRPNMMNFFNTAGAYETALQQGDCWLGMNTGTRARQLKQAGMKLEFVPPKEGVAGYATWLGITAGAPHPKAAHAWVNYFLDSAVQTRMADLLSYAPVNTEAKPPAGAEIYFPDFRNVFVPDWRYLTTQSAAIVNRWNKEVEG